MINDEKEQQSNELTNICLRGIKIALEDLKVLEVLNKKSEKTYIFSGIDCNTPTIPELIDVHFDFDCSTPCAIDPSLHVIVNLITEKVTDIVGADT